MAEYLNISSVHYYDLEKGEATLNQEYLEKLADFYGVTTDYLMCRGIIIKQQEEFPDDIKLIARDLIDLAPAQRRSVHNIIKDFKTLLKE